MRAVWSCDAVTTRVPSGEKATKFTRPLCWSTAISAPTLTLQIRTVLSSDAVTTRVASGEKAAWLTLSVCLSTAIRAPDLPFPGVLTSGRVLLEPLKQTVAIGRRGRRRIAYAFPLGGCGSL